MNTTKNMKMIEKTTHKSMHKKWLYASLAAAALTLSACADKEAPMSEDETAMDAQAEVEQGAIGVANDNHMANEDVAVASEDMDMANDANTDMMNDDVAVAEANDGVAVGVDDSEMLDGSESEEHVSTY
ncbi:hypothetical protein [Psychrobacter sp. ASPA161_9]|uniref:hypothetical protein n=1 Tax=Psychrobacter sp. ASPA161_9 TaxID=3160961 RepID=UPI003F8210E2